ncbi:tetratricopeptide repeat protein [Rubripirellula obstinata]|nr:hypothetical protein [Rubripirellula obstinata]
MTSIQSQMPQEKLPSKPGQWRIVHACDLTRKYFEPETKLTGGTEQTAGDAALSKLHSLGTDSSQTQPIQTEIDQARLLDQTAENEKVVLQRRQHLEQHIRSNPTDPNSFLELGQIYRLEQKPIEAKRVLEQATELFPDNHELRWEFEEATLARSLQQLREVAELANRLETAEADRELHRCQHDWACRRIEICQARLERDPSKIHLRVALGEAMLDAGMYEGAIEELEPLLEIDAFSPSAYLLRGKCLLAMNKDLDAMVELRACAMRRSVPAPLRLRILSLRLLCETAERLGIQLTLNRYRELLRQAETEFAKQSASANVS